MTRSLHAYMQRISFCLAEHAVTVMPAARKEWARAMRAELASLDVGIERIRWSFGCLRAAYSERVRNFAVLDRLAVRILIALLSLNEAHRLLWSAKLAWIYRTNPNWAARYLGSENLQVYAAIPTLLIGLSAISASLYAVAAAYLVRHRRNAVPYYAAAVGTELVSLMGFSWVSVSVDSWSLKSEASHYGVWLGYTVLALMIANHFRHGEFPPSRGPT
jgi:hypothetical protein